MLLCFSLLLSLMLVSELMIRGAMENKSLNVRIISLHRSCSHLIVTSHNYALIAFLQIFNSKLVLASPETASDADHAAILGVIGHEVC